MEDTAIVRIEEARFSVYFGFINSKNGINTVRPTSKKLQQIFKSLPFLKYEPKYRSPLNGRANVSKAGLRVRQRAFGNSVKPISDKLMTLTDSRLKADTDEISSFPSLKASLLTQARLLGATFHIFMRRSNEDNEN